MINGKKIKSRKKTNNKWFETQDQISYWDDFSKPKILYPCIMADGPKFSLDISGKYYTPAPGNIITGKHLNFLLNSLCSEIYYFALRKFYMGGGIEGELKTNRLLLLPIPLWRNNNLFSIIETSEDDASINNSISSILQLSDEERLHIHNYCKQLK